MANGTAGSGWNGQDVKQRWNPLHWGPVRWGLALLFPVIVASVVWGMRLETRVTVIESNRFTSSDGGAITEALVQHERTEGHSVIVERQAQHEEAAALFQERLLVRLERMEDKMDRLLENQK